MSIINFFLWKHCTGMSLILIYYYLFAAVQCIGFFWSCSMCRSHQHEISWNGQSFGKVLSTKKCTLIVIIHEYVWIFYFLSQVRNALVSERERLFTKLREIPYLEPYPSHANFILAKVSPYKYFVFVCNCSINRAHIHYGNHIYTETIYIVHFFI